MFERDYIEKFKDIQTKLLDFLDNDQDDDDNFEDQLFKNTKIRYCQHEFRLFLHMLVKIANNHHRGPNFFTKIERILLLFKEDIIKYDNARIFRFFKSNKRILLFLIEEKIITVDDYFVKQIIQKKYLNRKYPQYFAPEIIPFVDKKWFPKYNKNKPDTKENKWVEDIKKELPENFYELRKNGENEDYLCKLIREDLDEDFIEYVNSNSIELETKISGSIYETNSFLIKKNITLIEYSAFFGSNRIFTLLKNEGIMLTTTLLLCAIHSQNAELINHAKSEVTVDNSFIELFKESIKCHHNNIGNYFVDNFLNNNVKNSNDTIICSIKYYNFSILPNNGISKSLFYHLCRYDYYFLAEFQLKKSNIDINSKVVQNQTLQ